MVSAFSQNQFLGSRISLVSKSEIRYEGILYALDLCEATISLAKVRSFGTEDRPTERPVPPKDDVYEYIIFRGADIKVIDVVEPPKHGSNSGMPGALPSDPAIVDFSHGGGHYGNGNHFDGGRGGGGGGGPPMYNGGPHNGGGGMRRRSGGYNPNDGGNGQNNGRGGNNMGRNMGGGGGGGGHPGRQNYGPPGGRNNFGGNFRQGGYIPRDNNGGQFQQRGGRTTTPNRGGNYGQPQQQRRGGRQQGGGGGGGQGGNRTPFRNRGMNQAAFPPKVAFDGDYDFEKANEELLSTLAKAKLDDESENKSDDEGQKDEQENKDKTFYKKDNFFDNISCEALERSKGNVPRVDWKAERKLNAETFGLSQTHPGNNGGGNMRSNSRRPRVPRGMPNMNMNMSGGNNWMMSSPNNFFRGGNNNSRRPRN